MTSFKFWVANVPQADKALASIEKKWKANKDAQKALYRKISKVESATYKVDFLFPFPDLRVPALFFLVTTCLIVLIKPWYWLFIGNAIIIATAYLINYMLSPAYLFKMLKRGMRKHGYKEGIWRVIEYGNERH
jgi:hypothetical protein